MLDERLRQAARHARVQARGRPLRPAHVPPRLPGHGQQGRLHRQHRATARRSRSAASCACTPTTKEEITDAGAGDICAMFGIDCNSGDTFTDGTVNVAMTSMFVPDAGHLASRSSRRTQGAEINMSQGAQPLHAARTRRSSAGVDPGVERDDHRRHGRAPPRRLHRAHEARVQGRGRHLARRSVAYRETITQKVEFNYTHKKQTGGSGQYGKVVGYAEPFEGDFEFVDEITGGAIPREFISVVREGLQVDARRRRRASACPVVGRARRDQRRRSPRGRLVATSRSRKPLAARCASSSRRANPKILEPIMKVVDRGPGRVLGQHPRHSSCSAAASSSARPKRTATRASTPRCRSPRCSASRRRSARRRRARPSSRWSSRSTPRCRTTSREELLAKAKKAKEDARK